MSEVSTIGLDIAKNAFHAHGADSDGRAKFSRKINRTKLLEFFARQPRCLVALEACGGAHHWARELTQLGHEVKLIPPAYVKPFVKRNKNDLWALEDTVRGQIAPTRAAARRQASAPVVAELFKLWEATLPRISGKSKLAEAIRYARARRASLERFLDDGRVELDSNIVERAIRPQTITRKNSLFAGSDGGGRSWATIASLLQTARMNAVDPFAWLTQTLERIANGWPNSDLEALMPWNYCP